MGTQGCLSAHGAEQALERTLSAHGAERNAWTPGPERALERTASAPGTERENEASSQNEASVMAVSVP